MEPWRGEEWRVERWICRPAVSGTGPIMDGHLLVTADFAAGDGGIFGAAWLHQGERHSRIRTPFSAGDPATRYRPARPSSADGCRSTADEPLPNTPPKTPPQHPLRGAVRRGGAQPQRRERGGNLSAAQQVGAALPATRVSVLVARQGANKCDGWPLASSITEQLTTLCKRGGPIMIGAHWSQRRSPRLTWEK